jgi:serpin B
MKATRFAIALIAVAVLAAACGSTTDSPPTTSGAPGVTNPPSSSIPFTNGELVKLDIPRAAGAVDAAVLAAVVRGDTQFGLDLFEEIAGDGNLMFSPYSIATALSMLYPGARGTTAEEIAAVLHLDVDDEALHAARNVIERLLTEAAPAIPDDEREPFTIRPANSAWGQGGFPFSDDYLAVLASAYGAGLRVVDFEGDPDRARDLINGWVEEATEDRIQDLIPDGAVDALTRLVLVNAVWFKANWAEQFDPDTTAPGTFTRLDGSDVTTPLMHSTTTGQYAAMPAFTAVRLPYAGDAAMVVVLPDPGTSPAELAASMTADDLAIEWGTAQIDLTLPSFQFESRISLKQALQELGMTSAFTGSADLSGITDASALFVQDALHKSFIALDENGTEAAAATAILVGLTSAPPPASFTADRPFLFWIEHSSTGELLFLGQVTDPS